MSSESSSHGRVFCTRLVDEIVWVKMTVNKRLAKSHGYYLQHAKEICLVAKRGNTPAMHKSIGSDVICSERRGQSQKPEEIYHLIEQLFPGGKLKQETCFMPKERRVSALLVLQMRGNAAQNLFLAGTYLEIFGRKNNLRNYWVTVGNEVTGTGRE